MDHAINKHQEAMECLVSAIRGFRNGVITGARIRIPYMLQAVVYGFLFDNGK